MQPYQEEYFPENFRRARAKGVKIVAAELIGRENDLGSIETGKIGDFVVLNDNPLDDISNLENINCVIKEGLIVYNQG